MASSGNFSTFNPLDNTENNGVGGCDFAIGNCQGGGAGDNVGIASTIATGNTGKYYAEFYLSATPGTAYVGYYPSTESAIMTKVWVPSGNRTWLTSNLASYAQNGTLYKDGNTSTSSWGSTFTTGDIIQIAIDADNDAVYYGKNNTWQNSGNPESGASKTGAARTSIPKNVFPAVGHANGSGTVTWKANFGQDSTFGGTISAGGNADANGFGDFKYAPPSGYTCLSTSSVPVSDDIDPAQTDDNFPQKQFEALAYTGTGSSNAVTGLGFQPDLVVIKNRSGTQGTKWTDSSRGVTKVLQSATTSAESTDSNGLTAFGTDGFTVGSDAGYNGSSNNIIAWCWRANGGTTASNTQGSITSTVQANTKAGFSIITFTSPSSSADQTVGHGLSAAPEFIIVKKRDNTANWNIFHKDLGANQGLRFTTATPISNAFGSMSATTIGVKSPYSYYSNDDYVHYAWHSVEGYSNFGSYEGNGNTDGAFVYTGFRPRMVILKQIDGAAEWACYDTARDTFNMAERCLEWDLSAAEKTSSDLSTDGLDFLSNGFKFRGGGGGRTNQSGRTFIYGAWGDVPFKYNNTF